MSVLPFENNFDDKNLYNSIFFQPVFSDENGVVIEPNNSKVIVKSLDASKSSDTLFFKKIELFDKHVKNLILLNQFVKIDKYKNTSFKQDIMNYDDLSLMSLSKNRFNFKKGKKYFVHFEYQLCKEYFLSKVEKKAIEKSEKTGYKPYFGKLISNRVPFLPN